jgi:LuxR family transcriptional regulator, maltose regulon positive regulatory protein
MEMRESSMELPTGYHLERVPDMLVLRRHDGVMVGAFSPRGVTSEAVRRTVEEIARQELREPDTPDSEAPNQGSQDAAPSKLQARFFGHFELMCDEEILDLGPNGKALTILKYLLANRSRPVSQDHLMGWLWPESNLKKARWSLNSAIHALRKLLSRSPHSVAVNYVLLEEGYYSLSPEIGVSTDVEEFDARYERGRLLERTGEAAQATSEYEKAIELYRGDYLVEDLYEDWTMVERERLANAYVDMLDRLAAHYLQNGQFRESVRCCYLALEKDRCHEASYRLLIRCYSQMGRLSSAVRQYRMCEHILEQEYGTSPSTETKSLLEGITMV